MATAEVIKRLATRATAAEQMIQILTKQISEIKASGGAGGNVAQEMQQLKTENAQLRSQVEEWKNKLIAAEKANGIVQVEVKQPPKSEASASSNVKEPSPKPVQDQAPKEAKKDKKKNKEDSGKKAAPGGGDDNPVDVGRLDMRVGLIRTAKKHPDADSLYVEEVDVGEEKPRTVISGLVKFIPEAEMQNRRAIIMCNLKPSKMRGIMSEAMVMCASTPEKVEILSPPEDAKPGDLVYVEGFERRPDAQLNPKKKIFEACAPDLKVNGDKVATYKDIPWTVNGKFCHAQTLTNVQVK